MRTVRDFLVLVVFFVFAEAVHASLDFSAGRTEAEQMDTREILIDDLLKAAKSLMPFATEEDRAAHIQLRAFAARLRIDSGRFSRLKREDVLALQRRLEPQAENVRKRLENAEHWQQRFTNVAARLSSDSRQAMMPPNVDWTKMPPIYRQRHEWGKRRAEEAQTLEGRARHWANVAALLTKEAKARQHVSDLLIELAQQVPSTPQNAPPAKKESR